MKRHREACQRKRDKVQNGRVEKRKNDNKGKDFMTFQKPVKCRIAMRLSYEYERVQEYIGNSFLRSQEDHSTIKICNTSSIYQ